MSIFLFVKKIDYLWVCLIFLSTESPCIVAGDGIEYYFAGEDDNWCGLVRTGVLERVSLAKVPDVDL